MSSPRERCYGKKIRVLGQKLKACPGMGTGDKEDENKGKGITRKTGRE